jgi:hypothetical protein
MKFWVTTRETWQNFSALRFLLMTSNYPWVMFITYLLVGYKDLLADFSQLKSPYYPFAVFIDFSVVVC